MNKCDICRKPAPRVTSMGRDRNGEPDAPDVCDECLAGEYGQTIDDNDDPRHDGCCAGLGCSQCWYTR